MRRVCEGVEGAGRINYILERELVGKQGEGAERRKRKSRGREEGVEGEGRRGEERSVELLHEVLVFLLHRDPRTSEAPLPLLPTSAPTLQLLSPLRSPPLPSLPPSTPLPHILAPVT